MADAARSPQFAAAPASLGRKSTGRSQNGYGTIKCIGRVHDMLTTYYRLTKPGIIYGNLLSTTAGFFLAANGSINLGLLAATLLGTALGIGAGCVFNNYIDRGIDAKMARTKKRALVAGDISGRHALIYGSVLGILGFGILALFTNYLVLLTGLVGFVFYVVLYGIVKRRSTLGTVVGAIPGATPPVAGYVAVSGSFDLGAGLVFLALAIWQLPHFYSIAIFRQSDYKAAGIPVLPVKKGKHLTKVYILLYIGAYALAVALFGVFGYTSWAFAAVMVLVSLLWLKKGLAGFRAPDDVAWARRMFGFSLLVLLLFSLGLVVDSLLA